MPILLHRGQFTTTAWLDGSRSGLTTLALLGAVVCGSGGTPAGAVSPGEAPVAETAAEDAAEVVSGVYEVHGVTVQAADGRQRGVSGTVELNVKGGHYEVRFELATTAPDAEALPTTIMGSGRGWVVDGGPGSPRILAGSTEEEMAVASARSAESSEEAGTASLKIVSTSQAYFDDDGALVIHLQNQASEGASYSPSVTTLLGRRAGAPRDVAAPPPLSPPAASLADDAAAGKKVYDVNCMPCHGPTGRGDGPVGEALNPAPRDFSAGQFRLDTDADGKAGTDADLADVISNGGAAYGRSPLMAAWGARLSDADVQNLIAFIRSLEQ